MNLIFEQFLFILVMSITWSYLGCILYYQLANKVTRKLQKISLYVLSGPIMWVIIPTRSIVKYTIVLLPNRIGNWLTKK
jgi:hypothetical protein